MVSVHWWSEYQKEYNLYQEAVWKKLIDCGADIIIWHHPHVPQDILWYKNKPIIFSLWNFLFDQWFSDETKSGIYVLIDIQNTWQITLSTGTVNAHPDTSFNR